MELCTDKNKIELTFLRRPCIAGTTNNFPWGESIGQTDSKTTQKPVYIYRSNKKKARERI